MIALIYSARQEVIIATPYFVPDEPFLQAIVAASRRGVRVQLLLTKRSNQAVTHLAQQSYYSQLMQAGVEIALYQGCFLHAKHMAVDQRLVLIGSTNMDIRSFALNAEVSLLCYDEARHAPAAGGACQLPAREFGARSCALVAGGRCAAACCRIWRAWPTRCSRSRLAAGRASAPVVAPPTGNRTVLLVGERLSTCCIATCRGRTLPRMLRLLARLAGDVADHMPFQGIEHGLRAI